MYWFRNGITAIGSTAAGFAIGLVYKEGSELIWTSHASNAVKIPFYTIASNALSAASTILMDTKVISFAFKDPRVKFLLALGFGVVGTGSGVAFELLAHDLLAERFGELGAICLESLVPSAVSELLMFGAKFFKGTTVPTIGAPIIIDERSTLIAGVDPVEQDDDKSSYCIR